MYLKINQEFLNILQQINAEKKTVYEWREIESCDMFQSENFCGGFDATEDKFTFSYYDKESIEYWFEFSIHEIQEFVNGNITQVILRKANT